MAYALFLCGYSASNKDTFVKSINPTYTGTIVNWQIYSNDGEPFMFFKNDEKVEKPLITDVSYGTISKKKDIIFVQSKLLRNYYIEKENKDTDDTDWCLKVTLDCAITSKWTTSTEIDSLRSQGVKVQTGRVYKTISSLARLFEDRRLDNYLTDYLIVQTEEDFKSAISTFPQYAEYKLVTKV